MESFTVGEVITIRVRTGRNPTKLSAAAAAAATAISVYNANGYGNADTIVIKPGAVNDGEEFHTIGTPTGTSLPLSGSTLAYAHARGEIVAELAAPATLQLVVRAPDGTETTYTLAAVTVLTTATGRYYVEFTTTQEGEHPYRWTGTGIIGAADGVFHVRDSRLV